MADKPLRRELSLQDALDTGLIWMINRTSLHARGYAIGVDAKRGVLTIQGNGDEPWVFTGIDVDEDAKFRAFHDLLESVTPND